MPKEYIMTAAGKRELEERLEHIKLVEMPAIVEEIAKARAQGDLSENAEYEIAREEQAQLQNEIDAIKEMTILPNGDIFACRRVQNSKVGNVFDDRIADVWVCEMEKYRDYAKFEKCAKCELKAWCRGCPAVASGKDGNFYAADPQCWKEIS